METPDKKTKLILPLIFASVLVCIVFGMLFFSLQQQKRLDNPPPLTPTPTPNNIFNTPPITYDNDSSQRAYKMIDSKPLLSNKDTKAKNDLIISVLRSIDSGVVFETEDVQVVYVKSGDIFQAFMQTGNVDKAQKDTVAWFESKGLSKQGICNLPIIFSIDPLLAESLRGKNVTFHTLPPGC